ncbi:MAG: large conductance mechanosensitive channel protein MscL [Lachnospiraceae bacterium]|nr:large conductance mechanosensitive channel protein MscL [Lachnospiraceae bacterium]
MKKFVNEFKTFIKRGNVMDMAVGIIIGAAFKAIVDSLVNDIINPLLGLAGGMNFDQYVWNVNGAVVAYGKFITAIINFLIMAFIIFLLVRTINKMLSAGKKEEPKPVTTKKCPYCLSDIALEATRCPHCTSVLEEKKEEV